jgi:DNA-binding NtrC family response regulator
VSLLQSAGYHVSSAETDDQAMELLEEEKFDLILLGRRSLIATTGIDQRIRERYPQLLTLKIAPKGELHSVYPSRITDSVPERVISALKVMLDP